MGSASANPKNNSAIRIANIVLLVFSVLFFFLAGPVNPTHSWRCFFRNVVLWIAWTLCTAKDSDRIEHYALPCSQVRQERLGHCTRKDASLALVRSSVSLDTGTSPLQTGHTVNSYLLASTMYGGCVGYPVSSTASIFVPSFGCSRSQLVRGTAFTVPLKTYRAIQLPMLFGVLCAVLRCRSGHHVLVDQIDGIPTDANGNVLKLSIGARAGGGKSA